MTSLKPYARYKDSGSEWLGDVPDHWETPRLKRLATINPSKMEVASLPADLPVTFLPMEKVSETGCVDRGLLRPLQDVRNGFTYFKDGDVIVAKITPCFENGKAALVDDLENGVGFGSTEFHVLRSHGRLDRRYLYRMVSSYDFRTLGEASMEGAGGQKRVPTEFVANFATPLPPLDEQRAIADLLDGMDARITRFIAARRKMIALLEEQKQAVINQAVTRGLDPSVPMKDSGVDWLGEIPAHWELTPIARYWRVVDCKHVTVPFVEPSDNTFPLASVVQAQRFELDLSDAKHTTFDWYRFLIEGGRKPEPGDLIFCRNVSVGSAALVTSEGLFAMGQDVCLLKSSSQNSRFLNYSLLAGPARGWIDRTLVGSTFKRINVSQIRAIRLPLPPEDEQTKITTYLDDETSRIHALMARHRREIELIQEYQTRLISDVVTGKLDVRGVELSAIEESIGEEIEASLDVEEQGSQLAVNQ